KPDDHSRNQRSRRAAHSEPGHQPRNNPDRQRTDHPVKQHSHKQPLSIATLGNIKRDGARAQSFFPRLHLKASNAAANRDPSKSPEPGSPTNQPADSLLAALKFPGAREDQRRPAARSTRHAP